MSNPGQRPSESYLAAGLGQATSEMVEQQRQRDADLFPVEATEMAQQVHVDVKGKVGSRYVSTETIVRWPYPFLMNVSQSQNDSTLETPHFNHGVELKTDDHVMVDAYVIGWIEDDAKLYVGAKVRIVVWAPQAAKLVNYDASVHLTFMGYAAPTEDDDTTTTDQAG